MFCLLHNWHCTYSVIYFLNKFSTLLEVKIVFIIRPLLLIDPDVPPRSSRKKFITCSGCLSSCLQSEIKFKMTVFFEPIFSTLGGLSMIFVFYAKSGLFFVRVSIMRANKSLYLLAFFSAISASFCSYFLAFSFSSFFLFLSFFLAKSMTSICSNSSLINIRILNYYYYLTFSIANTLIIFIQKILE